MLIQIDVQPDTATLIRQATAKGISLDIVLHDALKEMDDKSIARKTVSLEEIDAQLDALAEGSDDAPTLPDEANSRAFYYEERI